MGENANVRECEWEGMSMGAMGMGGNANVYMGK